MLKKLLYTGALLAGTICSSSAQNTPSWMRYPAISPDGQTIVFTYKGDLYRVAANGGQAIPLTAHEAHDFMPVWSPDGKSIVFASDRYGNFDLFKMPATGGTAERMTFHSVNEYPYAFSPDGKTVFFGATRLDNASNRQYPAHYQPELYKVPVEGGRVLQVLTTPAEEVQLSQNGEIMLYMDRKGGENVWRKHHQSSVARDLWQYNTKTGKHTQLTTFAGEDRTPVFAENDKNVYYLSEQSGTFNVHKMPIDNPKASIQVTSFTKHPVRFLTASKNEVLSFGYDGEIYIKQPNAEPQKVNITLAVDAKTNNERIVQVAGSGVQDLAVSPNGKEVAFIYRGEVFVSAVEGNVTKRITNTPEQERSVSFSPDGKTLIYSSERGKGWAIYQTQLVRKEEPYFYASTLINETPLINNDKENYEPKFSPDGKEVAFVEDRVTLKVLNLASKQVRTLLTTSELFSMRDNDQYFTWSPDSKWIAFEFSEPGFWNGEVGVIAADGKSPKINLTESGYQDFAPQWMMGGKMLIWQSTREGMRAQAASGGAQSDVYAMFMTQEAFDKFKMSKEDYALIKEQEEKAAKEKEEEKKKEKDKKKKKEAEPMAIDWEGLKFRKARLTLHSSHLADAVVSKDGETLYYLAKFEKGYNLWSTNLRTKETKMAVTLNATRASMNWDKDLKNLFLLTDGKVVKLDPSNNKQESVSISGDLNLNVAAERAFMFDHVWRRTQKVFYTAGLHGANWEALKPDYEKYLPHISNNYEFSEMLSELLGELNVSHSGASFSNVPANADATASLGVFFDQTYTGNGLKIEEVIAQGPLKKAGLDVKAGMIIEKIDGEELTSDKDYAQFLNRKAGKNILLTVFDPNSKKRRDITVKPISLSEENTLLYKRWVLRNAEEVDRLSNGQLGYVHIPGMNDGAYRTVYEEVMGKYASRKGMVVDSRNNSGGDLVADLAMFLSGKMFLSYTTDGREVGMEPNFRWNKPSIALANEANYSDGHCFAFSYGDLKLGKLVGMPVPGTCTFGGWETLQDNSLRWGVPPLGVKDVQGRYLENLHTDPDIKVMNEYEVVSKGKDQQLEVAVQELLKEVK
ncbi:S41 family peptidase [Rufibacter roseus]|uniref:Tricorn protease homolog n=1 Tax=Rufibacter roseus TaxID=1567108 RepID=A0ABW2DQ07_9BACT|nr:S41 family peptidase [Rufibacter roseus]